MARPHHRYYYGGSLDATGDMVNETTHDWLDWKVRQSLAAADCSHQNHMDNAVADTPGSLYAICDISTASRCNGKLCSQV